jgi:hypothetical protein
MADMHIYDFTDGSVYAVPTSLDFEFLEHLDVIQSCSKLRPVLRENAKMCHPKIFQIKACSSLRIHFRKIMLQLFEEARYLQSVSRGIRLGSATRYAQPFLAKLKLRASVLLSHKG